MRSIISVVVLLVLVTVSTVAQPGLDIKRVVINWPTIELYFATTCNGSPVYNVPGANVTVYEDGVDMKTRFYCSYWYPDPSQTRYLSTVLIMDASLSMLGANRQAAISGALAFIESTNKPNNEFGFVSAGDPDTLKSHLTIAPSTINAVKQLGSSGASKLYDAIYKGVIEQTNNGVNQIRSVFVITASNDNGSSFTVSKIVQLANRHRIRIYAVALGSAVDSTLIKSITDPTGGNYYSVSDTSSVRGVCTEIGNILLDGYREGIFAYEQHCSDGAQRYSVLAIANYCNGTATDSISYQRPYDASAYDTVKIRTHDVTVLEGSQFSFPLEVEYSSPAHVLRPCDLVFLYDTSKLLFMGVSDAGTLLNGRTYSVNEAGGRIIITNLGEVLNVFQGATILNFIFKAKELGGASISQLQLENATSDWGCFECFANSSTINVHPVSTPKVNIIGTPILCDGESVQLLADTGFVSYVWSTGESGITIATKLPGLYYYQVEDVYGNFFYSDSITVVVNRRPTVSISPPGPRHLCYGDTISLTAMTSSDVTDIVWSNGALGEHCTVNEEGVYYASCKNIYGCWSISDSIVITVSQLAATLSISGQTQICAGIDFEVEVNEMYDSYLWSNGAITKAIVVDAPGTYWAEVRNNYGCRTNSDTLIVIEIPLFKPTLSINSDTVLCGKDSVWLTTEPYMEYKWSNGSTAVGQYIKESGVYYVSVLDSNGCWAHSDTISVVFVSSPKIIPAGPIEACHGTEVVLRTDDKYEYYYWNTGEHADSLIVRGPGTYFVEVETVEGCILSSDSVVVRFVESLRPSISIIGDLPFCEGDSVILDAGQGYAAYRWSTSSDTRKIVVFRSGVYSVAVTDVNGCIGFSDSVIVTVLPDPAPVITSSGPNIFCVGDSLILDAGAGYTRYRWTTTETAQTIIVTATGTYSVTVWNDAGCDGSATPVDVTVKPTPEKPTITRLSNVLTTGKADSYQWYRNGVELLGETNLFLAFTDIGLYQVKVTNESGCSAVSDPFQVISTGVEPPPTVHGFTVFPDPNAGRITVWFSSETPVIVGLTLTNLLGQTMFQLLESVPTTEFRRQIDLGEMLPGLYLLEVKAGESRWIRRIVRQ